MHHHLCVLRFSGFSFIVNIEVCEDDQNMNCSISVTEVLINYCV